MSLRLRQIRRDWRFVMWLLATVNLLELIAYVHMARFAPLFLQDVLHVSEADLPRLTGYVASSALLVGVPLSPFWGALADRYSRKWLILRSEFAQIASYGLVALSGDIWMLFVARLVFGIAFGNAALMIAVVSLVMPQEKVGTAIGVFQTAYPLAASLAPILGTVLIKLVGLRGLFAFDAAIVALAVLLLLVFMEEPPDRDTSISFRERLRQVFTLSAQVPAIRWSFILQFFMQAAITGVDPFVPIAIQRANATSPWGWDDPTALGIILGVSGLATAALTPLLGRLSDRLGAVPMIAGSTIIALGCVLTLALAHSLLAVWGVLLILSIPQAAAPMAFFAYLGTQIARAHRSGVLSLTQLPMNVAALLAPTLAATAAGLGFAAVFIVAGGFWALAAGTAFRLQRLAPSVKPAAAGDVRLQQG